AGKATTAVQLFQPVADLLRVLDRVGVVRIDRFPDTGVAADAGQRGGYLPLKRPSHVPFAPLPLDRLSAGGDDPRFPPRLWIESPAGRRRRSRRSWPGRACSVRTA